jgi:small neutral amino acid transporter SnatA (MarC family)
MLKTIEKIASVIAAALIMTITAPVFAICGMAIYYSLGLNCPRIEAAGNFLLSFFSYF